MKNLVLYSIFCVLLGFQMKAHAQCLTSPDGQYPSSTYSGPICDGSTVNEIAFDCFASDYSLVSLIAGNSYNFSSSISTDFITISNSAGTLAYVYGVGVQSYTPTVNENVRFFSHINAACSTAQSIRARNIVCTGGGSSGPCFNAPYGEWPGGVYYSAICDGSTLNEIDNGCYAGDYSSVAVFFGNTYEFYSSNSSDYITISDAAGIVAYTYGVGSQFYTPTVDEVIRFYTHTNSACGVEQTTRSRNIICSGGVTSSFGCLNDPNGKWPLADFVPACTGSPEIIAPDCETGQYSLVYLEPGYDYTFSSSNLNDWVTLADSLGTTGYVFEQAPINLQVTGGGGGGGYIRFYLHSDSVCGTDMLARSRIITCGLTVGLSEMNADEISVFPNPVSDKLTIDGKDVFNEIQLVSIDGRVLKTIHPTETLTEIDVNSLGQGNYFIRIMMNGRMVTKEFVKR